jgi:hypothetical protein
MQTSAKKNLDAENKGYFPILPFEECCHNVILGKNFCVEWSLDIHLKHH